jgi:hypothetical protein
MSGISCKLVPKLSSISSRISFIYEFQKRQKYVKRAQGYSCVQKETDGFLKPCAKPSYNVC